MTEAEVARPPWRVGQSPAGVEVVVEQDHRPVALIRSPLASSRLLSECIALSQARDSIATLDEDFHEGSRGLELPTAVSHGIRHLGSNFRLQRCYGS